MGSNVNMGSFGVTGVKRSFSLKTLFFYTSMLYSMTIGLIHVHQLETLYVMGSNVNMGSFGVTGVKRSIILKKP